VIAWVLRATTCSEDAADALAAVWRERIGAFQRGAPGYEGGVLLRDGVEVLAVSCWDELVAAEAPLDPLLSAVVGATAGGLLARPLSCQAKVL
jgi:hypothetical protein